MTGTARVAGRVDGRPVVVCVMCGCAELCADMCGAACGAVIARSFHAAACG